MPSFLNSFPARKSWKTSSQSIEQTHQILGNTFNVTYDYQYGKESHVTIGTEHQRQLNAGKVIQQTLVLSN